MLLNFARLDGLHSYNPYNRKERFLKPVWRKQFIERVNTVDVVCAKLFLLLCQESVAYLDKLWIHGTAIGLKTKLNLTSIHLIMYTPDRFDALNGFQVCLV